MQTELQLLYALPAYMLSVDLQSEEMQKEQ